ncbi:hypothetical protein [Streptomyces longispororuber]|uniref:hypothetical protein n=1 Tax=Streptomyces longispororuber TaxID=68230 RepID=UPI0036F68FE7
MHPDHHVLGRLCAELPALRRALRDAPERLALLDRVAEAALSGEALAPLMGELGIAVADTDDDPGVRGTPGWSRPWASGTERSVDGRYVCPQGRCVRAQVRGPGEELPMCHLRGQALTFVPGA